MIDFTVNKESLKHNIEKARENSIIIPTIKQMQHPELIPDSIKEKLSHTGLWDVDPVNLFRITWKNEPKESGGLFREVPNYIELPSALTGVKARIFAMVGKWFPTGCHKVGASFGCLAPRLVTGQFDATYHKARVNGIVVPVATFIVAGILEDGHRAILSVDSDLSENEVHWRRVLSRLVERGMHGVKLIVSDSHDGLRAAREATLPGIPWQRCQMHLQQNAQAHVTKAGLKAEVASDIRSVFHAGSLEEAKRLLAAVVEKYSTCQAKLAAWMEDNIPDGFTVFSFPEVVRQFLRTNNMEENLNKQIKSRTRLIPAFPNVASLMRLVSAICVEISDDWETGHYKYMCAIKEL